MDFLQILIFCTVFLFIGNISIASGNDFIDISHFPAKAFGFPDPKAGERLRKWSPKDGGNADEQGTYFEGDILIQSANGKYGLISVTNRWEKGIVPFTIEGDFNESQLTMITEAMNEFAVNTCIRFIPRTNEFDYISITGDNEGCFSAFGNTGGKIQLNLQIPECVDVVGIPIHEMMHVLGFFHEQSRSDRDEYVTIFFENIDPEFAYNFEVVSETIATTYNISYDYDSIMHYSPDSYSVNGFPTIVPTNESAIVMGMGQRIRLTQSDIKQINIMYNCPEVTTNSWFFDFINWVLIFLNIRAAGKE